MASSNSQSISRSQIDPDVSRAFIPKSRRNSTRRRRPSSSKMLLSPTSDNETFESSRKRCREEDHDHSDEGDEIAITSDGKSVTSFLSKHIPQTYNPLADRPTSPMANAPSADTKYCNRHRPDRKCRRQADEVSMEELQTVRIHLLLCLA
jgi:F-box/WD-40 domain protein MET30